MITKVYYSLRNNGDGSAGLLWFDGQALANIDQEFQDEGFAEPCTGWITIKHGLSIEIQDDVAMVDTVLADIEEELGQDYVVGNCRKKLERKKAAVLKLKTQKEKKA
jgi:hypothetical protein